MSAYPILGQVQLFAGNFAPRDWAFCHGQLLAISSNEALFSLLGTIYGGDGRTTFALPDLRGRTAIGAGTGPGLSGHPEGDRGGHETISLNVTHLPTHGHTLTTILDAAPGETTIPESGMVLAEASEDMYGPGTSRVATTLTSSTSGGNQPVNVRPPYLGCNYIITLQGTYPWRD